MVKTGGYTDIGKVRKLNEDSFFANDKFAIVSDGMGGHNKGEVASKIVISKMVERLNTPDKLSDNDIVTAISNTNKDVLTEASLNEEQQGMGATLVMAYWNGNEVLVANVGDSRCYKVTDNEIVQITKDHSLVQTLVDKGEMTKEQAKNSDKKNYIYRAVGVDEILNIDIFNITVTKGDILILCSDGLTNMLDDDEITDIINKKDSPENISKELVKCANDKGGTDNITVVAVMF